MIDTSAGWIKIWRKIRDWEWYTDANTFRVFLHVLINANYEDKRWHGILIKRGQYLTSVRKLSTDLKISIQQTRTALSNIQSTHEVTIETTHQYTLITVANYDSYQVDDRENNTVNNTEDNTQSNTASTHELTQHQHSSNTAPTTTEEYKNTKNINNTRNKTLNINNNNITRAREKIPEELKDDMEKYMLIQYEHGGEISTKTYQRSVRTLTALGDNNVESMRQILQNAIRDNDKYLRPLRLKVKTITDD